ncbi:hypothetical protein VNO80_24257 [Phaseolus coccineus]|uniref:DHHA1 domain-containing protein n=1 Tax=Phaseolus coccineus TaxID=3886 RepID=A0AAN9QP06_PHACN
MIEPENRKTQFCTSDERLAPTPVKILLTLLFPYRSGKTTINLVMNGCFINESRSQQHVNVNFIFYNECFQCPAKAWGKMVVCAAIVNVSSFKSNVETLSIPAAKKADIKNKIARLQDQVRKAQKQVAEENKRKAVIITAEKAELAASNGKAFCISRVDVGLDVAAVREAVTKAMDQKDLSVMVFSTDESTNKAVTAVPEKGDKGKLDVAEWLSNALGPRKGRCGKGKGGLATGQGTDAAHVNEAMDLAEKFKNTILFFYLFILHKKRLP